MNRDAIVGDATIAAAFLRTLAEHRLSAQTNSSLTSAYVRATTMARLAGGKLKPGRELEHADTAAAYLLALVERGVPRFDAASFAGEYIQSVVYSEMSQDKPKEPWENDGGPG